MDMTKDPVCHMDVNENKTQLKSEHMGKTYYFCSQECKAAFDKNPMKFMDEDTHSEHSCGCGCCC